MDELKSEKKAMRLAVADALRAVDSVRAAAGSEAICRRVLESRWWGGNGAVMLYWPMPGEVDVGPLARAAFAAGRVVCLPRVDWAARTMTACAMPDWGSGLAAGRLGVMQPDDGRPGVEPGEIGVVIVPGIAFDSACFRLGRGAGLYDRFLASPLLRAARIAVAFDEQIVDRVPRQPHDVRLDGIVTPTRMWSVGT